MKTLYTVNISKFATIQELPNAWNDKDYMTLLEEIIIEAITLDEQIPYASKRSPKPK